MLNKFANFRFTNVHKGIALLYGLGVYKGYRDYYNFPQYGNKRRYYIDHFIFANFTGVLYVVPPLCFFLWIDDLRQIEDFIKKSN